MADQWIEWLQAKQRHFFYGVTVVVAVVFLAVQGYGKFYKPNSQGYLTALQAFEKWIHQDGAFEKLEAVLHKQPELASKFASRIVDKLLSQNQLDKARPFAADVFQRVLKQTPEYAAFSEGSLLVAGGNLREALVKAVSLQENLDENSILYGFNLVRIATLNRALESSDLEFAALKNLTLYLQNHKEEGGLLSQCFQENSLTLPDYISHRISQLQGK